MGDTEEYFPRGGKKPTIKYFKQSGNFLGSAEKGEKKKKKEKKKSEADDGYLSDEASKDVDQSYKNCSARLNYKTVKAGVLILGRVGKVHDTKLSVLLPGRMFGTVMACHISEPYNKLLEAYVNDQAEKVRELHQMFRRGQYVVVKVLEAEGNRLMLSMVPHHINGGKRHTDLHKGDQLQAAVVSVEDHGYVMDIGVPNTRPFLPKNKANPEVELDVGVLTWCCVKSINSSDDSSIVTLSSELEALQRTTPRHTAVQQVTPGTPLYFTVDKPLENGIEGHVLDDVTAYIQRDHVDKIKGKKPALGQKVRTRVLYVIPTRNTPFLTMKDIFATTYPNMTEEQKIKEGDIVENAQVIKIIGRCVHFKLGGGCIGTMSLKTIAVDENLADEDIVAKSYPIGSSHKVRVLVYNMCDYSYTVSDRADALNERYFSLEQMSAGQFVDGTVTVVSSDHLLVHVGRLHGFVPHTHLSDAGVFLDPKKASSSKLSKKKYKVGQEVRARVLVIDEAKQSLLLTLKPSLLAPELDVLATYEDARVGKSYTGCVRAIRAEYMLVTFFNNVSAFVPRQYVTREQVDSLADGFHLGQIVKCTIIKVYPEVQKMTGSLVTEPFFGNERKRSEKRKEPISETSEVPNKRKKRNNDHIEETGKKKNNAEVVSEVSDHDEIDKSERKNKKRKKKDSESATENEETVKDSEDSDPIDTDVHDDMDVMLTPQEYELIDLANCTDIKRCKKRVTSLLKAINAKQVRLGKIEEKIARIEKKGLTARNKKFHTAMHGETLTVQERIKKLLDALIVVQERLKEFGYKDNDKIELTNDSDKIVLGNSGNDSVNESKSSELGKKLKKRKKADTDDDKEPKKAKVNKKEKNKSKKDKTKIKEKTNDQKLKVADSLEPAIDVPSAKEFWSANTDTVPNVHDIQEDDLSSSEDETKDQPKKKRKKLSVAEKLAKVREEEERVREMERRAIESESQPRSSEQFERALLANPDSSQLWIAYMAFHLQATEIEKARAVGRKALKTISFREEREKLNVWIAMLNVENRFGTKESQQKTLEEALQMNEPFEVHSKLLDIYVETSKQQELQALVDLMVRKYKRDPTTYIQCGSACYKLGLVDQARPVMQKAISVLEKKEHVSVLVQFALLERSHGESERAEALFEQVIAVYPQRVDVVATYVDMLAKGKDAEHARQVMERMTSQTLPARKMKALYKKWVEIEEKFGDQEQVDKIRQQAMDYIEKAKF